MELHCLILRAEVCEEIRNKSRITAVTLHWVWSNIANSISIYLGVFVKQKPTVELKLVVPGYLTLLKKWHYITIIGVYSSLSDTLLANTAFMVVLSAVKQVVHYTMDANLKADVFIDSMNTISSRTSPNMCYLTQQDGLDDSQVVVKPVYNVTYNTIRSKHIRLYKLHLKDSKMFLHIYISLRDYWIFSTRCSLLNVSTFTFQRNVAMDVDLRTSGSNFYSWFCITRAHIEYFQPDIHYYTLIH